MRCPIPGPTLLVLLLAGCGEQDALPPPGARGQAVVHLWDAGGGPPLTVETSLIEQDHAGDFDHLRLTPVRIRLENAQGVFYVQAERGLYHREAADSLVLEPARPDGRIHLSGVWQADGEPFFGVAARALFRQGEHLLALGSRVELIQRGRSDLFLEGARPTVGGTWPREWSVIPPREWTATPPMVFWNQDQRFLFGPNRRTNAPALVAALAALPRPMALPAPERGTRVTNR